MADKRQDTTISMDWMLLIAVLCVLAFGLIMVLSSSGIMAERHFGSKYHFFQRQLMFAGIGLVAMSICAMLPKRLIYQLHYPLLGMSICALIITLSPLGVKVNGASRWISVGPFSVQPMEFAKISLVLYLSYFFSTKQELVKTFSKGVIPPFLITAFLCALLLIQPDFGGAAVLAALLFFMCWYGGTRPLYLGGSGLLALGAGSLLILQSPYRYRRLLAFLDPFKDADSISYQLVQSLYAFGSGGFSGQGLGAGKQKLFYLPEAHNDFIMAVVGEELGFLGMSLFFVLMGMVLFRAFTISYKQTELRDKFITFGLALIISLGAVLNLAVVMGAAPPKGIAMPFMSYGGSNLIAMLLCTGLLLNFSRSQEERESRGRK
ncbi:putative lipid II flippase FtsW [Halodesulfovibrio sp. MK-HDV]|jgi:cell division protein FtsW|uniref:putative lipid II flippase FtsW n=1 Tax=unclassified Halodesulfovibrio TaxID=2644657 RepID=UPI00136E5644|nr:putative lipid II flippase FtsW [Halodesulfovibrio sp. MK-HDV]KAF1073998.1 putative peptidoglycan glycosyltransferase FtsW [Halodesulfovibrio sp. MK-HDV]